MNAAWVSGACASLFGPVARELAALPAWAQAEPEWVRIGLARADVLATARRMTGATFGLHAYARLVETAILDAPAIEAEVQTAVGTTFRPGALAAAHLQARRNLSDLGLLLEYLGDFDGPSAEDLHDLLGMWGAVEERVTRLIEVCGRHGPRAAKVAMRALSAPGIRPFVGRAEREYLQHVLVTGPNADLLRVLETSLEA